MAHLQTTFGGLKLKNPIIAASSGLSNDLSKIKALEKVGVSAIVLKSLFEEQIESHCQKLNYTSDYPEAADYINTYIKMNHVEKYLNIIRAAKAECSIPIIANINCYTLSHWVEFAKNIEEAGADALELNVFALNTGEFGDRYLEESYTNIVRNLSKTIQIPIIVKMSHTISNLSGLINHLSSLGANAFVLFNRFYALDIDINSREIVSGPTFSNPSDFSETLRWTAIVAGKTPKVQIGCSHGVHTWEDIVKAILAGASAVELASVLYEKGLDIVSEMLLCLEEWMEQNNYSSIEDFKGKLSYANIPDPSVYERIQFMKYFSNYQQ